MSELLETTHEQLGSVLMNVVRPEAKPITGLAAQSTASTWPEAAAGSGRTVYGQRGPGVSAVRSTITVTVASPEPALGIIVIHDWSFVIDQVNGILTGILPCRKPCLGWFLPSSNLGMSGSRPRIASFFHYGIPA